MLVPQIITHSLKMTLEIQILLDVASRGGRHLIRITTDVASILLADVGAQPALAEFGFEVIRIGLDRQMRGLRAF